MQAPFFTTIHRVKSYHLFAIPTKSFDILAGLYILQYSRFRLPKPAELFDNQYKSMTKEGGYQQATATATSEKL